MNIFGFVKSKLFFEKMMFHCGIIDLVADEDDFFTLNSSKDDMTDAIYQD